MPISRAEIATDSGAELINRLCEHWAPEFSVENDGKQGRVEFDAGVCLMVADDNQLNIAIEALDEASLDRLEGVLDSHLERMSGKEELGIVWEE